MIINEQLLEKILIKRMNQYSLLEHIIKEDLMEMRQQIHQVLNVMKHRQQMHLLILQQLMTKFY
jgi:hypothetical protein